MVQETLEKSVRTVNYVYNSCLTWIVDVMEYLSQDISRPSAQDWKFVQQLVILTPLEPHSYVRW